MFTAYTVRVAVHLTDNVSSTLNRISRQMGQTHAQAQALQQRLDKIRLMFGTGMLLAGAGFAGLEVIKSAVKPAMEYAHQLNIMNNLGMSQVEIAQAVGAAWKNTGTVITTTATGNLRALVDLRNILADANKMRQEGGEGPIDMSMAYSMLPVLTKLQAVMMSSTLPEVANIGKSDKFIYDIAKTLDIRGAATDPARFAREADLMTRAIMGMQGRITPEMFRMAMVYARQEKFQLSDEFLYARGLPTLLLEQAGGQAGGQRGIGPMLAALNRYFVQNIHTPAATAEAIKLGLIDHFEKIPGGGPFGKTKEMGVLRGQDLALTDPYRLATEVILPAILKKFPGATDQTITTELAKLFQGNQLLADVMLRFIHQSANFIRDAQIIHGVLPTDTAYQQSLYRDPEMAFRALGAQWENLKTAFGTAVIPILIPAIMDLADALQSFTQWARENPEPVHMLTYAFTGLSAALLFSGAVLTLKAAFMGLATVLTIGGAIGGGGLIVSLGAVATALVAVGAAAIFFAGTPLGKAFFGEWFPKPGQGVKDFRPTKYGAKVPGADTDVFAMPGVEGVPGAFPRPPIRLFTSSQPNITTPSSGDMRERNAVADLSVTLSGDARERQRQDADFLQRLGTIIREGLVAGLAGVTIKMDGATVGRLLDDRARNEMSRPPRDSGYTPGRNLPLRPADAF